MTHDNKTINWKLLSIIAVVAIAGYRLFLILWQFNFFHFIVPPSPDLAAHLKMTDGFIDGTWQIGAYPPLLHVVVAFLAKLFHTGSLEVFNFIAPLWIPLAIVVFYLMSVKLFDYRVAFWATIIFGLVSSNPLLNFADAQYADILGYNLIGPFYIMALASLIKKFNYYKLFLVFVLFGLFLSAHNLSSTLIYIVTILSIIVYCFFSYRSDKVQFKNSFYILIALCLGSIIFLSLSKVFFGPIIVGALKGLLGSGRLVQDNTSAVLDYSQLQVLLVPFLEFIGIAGLGFLMLRVSNNKTRFASLFVVVWIVVTWIFSRSDLFVLPQRLFREISLPLSLAAGVLVVDLLSLIKSNWLKISFMGIVFYLIIINNVQVVVSPFKLPDGFKNQIWFREVDQQKYDFILSNVDKSEKILANAANPILSYKLERAGYTVVAYGDPKSQASTDLAGDATKDNRKRLVESSVEGRGADYLLIGQAPTEVDPEVYFQQFVDYKEATQALEEYDYPAANLVKQFNDGTKLIKIGGPIAKQSL